MLSSLPRLLILELCLALGGCTYIGYRSGVPGTPASGTAQANFFGVNASVSMNSVAGALLVAVILADGVHYYLRAPDGTLTPYYGAPDPDPARRVSVQDCTRPIDPSSGNLLCR